MRNFCQNVPPCSLVQNRLSFWGGVGISCPIVAIKNNIYNSFTPQIEPVRSPAKSGRFYHAAERDITEYGKFHNGRYEKLGSGLRNIRLLPDAQQKLDVIIAPCIEYSIIDRAAKKSTYS